MRLCVAAMLLVAAAGLGTVCVGQTADDTSGASSAAQPADKAMTAISKNITTKKDNDNGGSYPKPLIVPLEWEFKLELGKFRPIAVKLPNKDTEQVFWYLRYTVTNKSGEDHIFVPEFVLYTENGQIIRAGKKTPGTVFDKIKKLYNDPLMKAPAAMTGKLLQGQDNAKSSVAIWPDFDPNAGKVSVFLGGLSGETASIPLPSPITVVQTDWRGQEKTVTKDKLLLVKTLHLQYDIPGEKSARRFLTPKLIKKCWVMR
ncbi:MAG: hypothetical protein ACTSW2_01350 [Alphaproteobacteria bacterium]